MTDNEHVNIEESVQMPKKRGRKPKNKIEPLTTTDTKKDTRQKKADVTISNVEAVSNVSGISKMMIVSKIENTILHFPIKIELFVKSPSVESEKGETRNKFIENEVLSYQPTLYEPVPYDPNVYMNMNANHIRNGDVQQFDSQASYSFSFINQSSMIPTLNSNPNIYKQSEEKKKMTIIPILPTFVEATNESSRMPERTNVACYWCTESFDTEPVGLPEKKLDNTFFVTRCFCDFNCAASFNFHMNDEKMWERYALLNLMYQKTYNTDRIVKVNLAPPRESHVKFGGKLSTQEFREYSKQNRTKALKLVEYPVITIQNYIEETDISVQENESIHSTSNTQTADVKNYLDKMNDNYKLSRKKSNTMKNTLEMCMGLKKL